MLSDKLEVVDGGVIHGRGVVARRTLPPGTEVWRPDPAFPDLSRDELAAERAAGNQEYYSQTGADRYARNSSSAWRMNHSCAPNCHIKDGRMVTFKPVCSGDEVCYDYGLTEISLFDYFWCTCGAPQCRKLITSRDYLVAAIYERDPEAAADFVKALRRPARLSSAVRLRRGLLRLRHDYLGWMPMPPRVKKLANSMMGRYN